MGTADLSKDLGCATTRDRQPLFTSLSLGMLAARANGLVAIDGVNLDADDQQGFEFQCHQGRDMGFDGKTLIHAQTVEFANRVFSPSLQTVEYCQRLLEAYNDALSKGEGMAVLDGKLIENLHAESAKKTLEKHE